MLVDPLVRFFRRLRSYWRRDDLDRELDEEMRFHLEMKEREYVAKGMAPAEARNAARRQLGNLTSRKEESREEWRFAAFDRLVQNIRFGARALRTSRGFTIAALLSMTLGIGATTAIFSVIDGVLLRPLPYPEPDRLVVVGERTRDQDLPVSYPSFLDYKAQSQTLQDLAAYRNESFNLTGTGDPERLETLAVSASVFATLGVRPFLGREIAAEEDAPGAAAVVVLGHAFWQRRFGGSANVVGRSLSLNQREFTVVGVMPAAFAFGGPVDIYVPISLFRERLAERGKDAGVAVVGRMRPGVELAALRTEMDTIGARLEQQYPDALAGRRAVVDGLHERLVRNVRPTLLILLGAVGLVLLISCANVANLLLERASARRKELAIHSALGASRSRLIQQLLVESLLLSLGGGVLGLLLTYLSVDVLATFVPDSMPRASALAIDGTVLAFTLGVSLLTGVVFGLVPALQVSRPDLNELLKEGGRGSTGNRQRARRLLIAAEFALTAMLLVSGGLLAKSFLRLQQVNPGFDAGRLLAMQMLVPAGKEDGGKVAAFFAELRRRIEGLPGVSAAAFSNGLPFTGANQVPFVIEGRPPVEGAKPLAALYVSSFDYHRTMGIRLTQGRVFSERDTRDAPRVALIDEVMAQRFFPGESPLGKRIRLAVPSMEREPGLEIVGVVEHVENRDLDGTAPVQPQLYFDLDQVPEATLPTLMRRINVVVRTTTDPVTLAQPVRRQVAALNGDQPVFNIRTMEGLVGDTIAAQRFSMLLVSIFAGIALVTAAIGIYGLMAYNVIQRRREVGIRLALGAQARDVLRLIVGQGMKVAMVGLIVGLAAAVAVTRLLTSLLFGVSATDPFIFATVAGLLGATALLSCYGPARRAARVVPLAALREE